MNPIDESFILEMDSTLIEQGVSLHARPMHVVEAWLRTKKISGNFLDSRLWDPLMLFYKRLYPREKFSLPALLAGGIALRDRVYPVEVKVQFGRGAINPVDCIEIDSAELNFIFQKFPLQFWAAYYGVCDLIDFAMGVDDLIKLGSPSTQLLNNARSSLVATWRILSADIDIDSAVQSTCLCAELALKAALTHLGSTEAQLKKLSHSLPSLANALIVTCPAPTDEWLRAACGSFPNYVASRYTSHGLTRVELMSLAMRAQFVAADSLRRISRRNLGAQVENSGDVPARLQPW